MILLNYVNTKENSIDSLFFNVLLFKFNVSTDICIEIYKNIYLAELFIEKKNDKKLKNFTAKLAILLVKNSYLEHLKYL